MGIIKTKIRDEPLPEGVVMRTILRLPMRYTQL